MYARIIAAESARRRLRKAAARLVHTARDASLPHPVPAALAEADTLASVVDDIAAAFPAHSGSLSRTPAPPPALHDGLWQCLTALVRRHVPVDPVTVIWEAQQRGVLSAADDPRVLLTFLAEPDVSAPYLGECILHRSVLTTALHVGRRIMAFTDDPTNTPYQLVVGSRRALAELTAIRARWHHATTPTPTTWSPRRTARAVPRAGPPPTTAAPTNRIAR
ncbi:hypothetical protein ABT270_01950 [Streptomyces sp900105245]|uniref:hypothetical protein n=1 Tax=Streptomyces sp. 900105245 TaxID=3154379 RepID=UPI00332D4E2E